MDPAIISAQPLTGTTGPFSNPRVTSTSTSSSTDSNSKFNTLVPTLEDVLYNKIRMHSGDHHSADDISDYEEDDYSNDSFLPVNPLNPDGKTFIYSIEILLELKDSPKCKCPESLVLPDITP